MGHSFCLPQAYSSAKNILLRAHLFQDLRPHRTVEDAVVGTCFESIERRKDQDLQTVRRVTVECVSGDTTLIHIKQVAVVTVVMHVLD